MEQRFGHYELERVHDPSLARHLELPLSVVCHRTERDLNIIERFGPHFLSLAYVATDRAQHFALGFLSPITTPTPPSTPA